MIMNQYDNLSREELIQRLEALEHQAINKSGHATRFSELHASKILESLPDMISVLDRQGNLVELISSEQTNHTGMPSSDFIGKSVKTFLSDHTFHTILETLNKAFATGEVCTAYPDLYPNNQIRNYETRIFPLDDQYALCMCRDITEAKRTETRLNLLQHAMNYVDEEIYACGTDGSMHYANELFRNHHHITDDITQHKVYEFWSFDANKFQWEGRLAKIRNDKGQHKYSIRLKDQQGHICAWDIVAYIVESANEGETVWFFGRDITLRAEREYKIKEMNSILDSVLRNIPLYLFVKDPANEFRYLYWNQAIATLSGISDQQAIGHNDYEICADKSRCESSRARDMEILRTGGTQSVEHEFLTADGSNRIFSTMRILAPVENRLPLIIGMGWDITRQKEAEQKIIEARMRAENSDKLKSAFLANMSHEIRTPLNAIIGFAKLITSAESDEEKQQFAEIIDSNADLLLQLINDILDLSKIEAGTLKFTYRPMDLNDLCRSEYEVLKMRVKPGVELIFEQKYDQAPIDCDQNRLSQVITNLINNAIKFTEKGEIRFGFDLRDKWADFYVSDTGVGIPQEKLDGVFERFVKLHESAPGTGLGLSISRTIIHRLGGTIRVESKLGQGTCFRFSIPVAEPTDTTGTKE